MFYVTCNITSCAFVQQTCASEVRPESSHGKLGANSAFHWLVSLAGNVMHYRLLYRCAWLNTKGRNMLCVCFSCYIKQSYVDRNDD